MHTRSLTIGHARALALLAAVLLQVPAAAAEAVIAGLHIQVPPSFEGPSRTNGSDGLEMLGYATSIPHARFQSVLHLTRMTSESMPVGMGEKQHKEAVVTSLIEMLPRVRQRRTEFVQEAPENIRLGGLIAARVRWHGKTDGEADSGVDYCVFVGKDVVWLSAFGPGAVPSEQTRLAIKAIESLEQQKNNK